MNPKYSTSSRRLWCLYVCCMVVGLSGVEAASRQGQPTRVLTPAVGPNRYGFMNIVFYGVVVASAVLVLVLKRHTDIIDLPVTIIACSTLLVSGAFVVFGLRLRRRAHSLSAPARRKLNSVLQALSLVLTLCTLLFLLQCVFFVSRLVRPAAPDDRSVSVAQKLVEVDKCGSVQIDYVLCQALGVWLPELVPCACMLLLMWKNVDESQM